MAETKFTIEEKDVSAVVPGWYIRERFETKELAEARLKVFREAFRDVPFRISERPTEVAEKGGLYQELGGGALPAREKEGYRERETQRLAEQAAEKTAEGKALSVPEKEALRRVEKITYTIEGKETTGTGKTFLQRAEMGEFKDKTPEVIFSEKAFQRGEELFGEDTGAGLEPPIGRTARIVPEKPFEEQKYESIIVGLEKPKPGELIVKPYEEKKEIIPGDLMGLGTDAVKKGILPPISTYTERPPPKDILEKVTRKAEELEFTGTFRTEGRESEKYIYGALGLSILSVPLALVTHPIQTLKSTFQAVIHPVQTLKQIGTGLKETPALAVGQIGGMVLTGKLLGVAGRKAAPIIKEYAPKVKFGKFELPTVMEKVKVTKKVPPPPTKIKTVGLVWGTKAQPLATWKTPGFLIRDIQYGTPDISKHLLRLQAGADIKIGGALETKIIRRGLLQKGLEVTERGLKAIPPMQRILIKTKRVKSRFVTELPKRTERMGVRGTRATLDIIREEKRRGVIFGGFARKGQLPKDVVARLRDIDIRFDFATADEINLITQKALGKYKGIGYKVREVPGMEGAIERKIGKDWLKVVEFKGKEPMVKGEIVPEEILGLTKVGKPTEIDKMAVTTLSEELRGVTQGMMRVQKRDGMLDIYPIPKRLKDIESTSIAARALAESKFIPSKQLGRDIAEIERLFGVKDTGKRELGIFDFRPSPKPKIKLGKPIPSPLAIPRMARVSPGISPRARISPPSLAPSPHISPSISVSKSPSISKSISPSLSPSVSASVSASVSPSVSPSLSPSLSVSPSPSISVSPSLSISPSPSPSLSPSPSISPSPKPSVSPRPSPYPSGYPYPSPIPYPYLPPTTTGYIWDGFKEPPPRKKLKRKIAFKRPYKGVPSVSVIFGGPGIQLTRKQIRGEAMISPYLRRKV